MTKNKHSKNYGFYTKLLLALMMLYGAMTNVTAVAADESASRPLPLVSVATVSSGKLTARTHVSGTLIAREEVLINPQISGHEIRSLKVDVGDHVKAGDILVQLDSETLQAQLAQADADISRVEASIGQAKSQINSANANLAQANITLKRNKRLKSSGAIPQATLDESMATVGVTKAAYQSARQGLLVARAQLKQSVAQRRIAALNLQRATIKSPVQGIISERNAKLGDIATAGGVPLFKIIARDEVELEATVIETSLAQIKKGDVALINVAGLGERAGKVRLISPTIDSQTRLGMIRVSFNKDPALPSLKAGSFADGWIITKQKVALQIPLSAIQSSETGDEVLVVKDGVLEKRQIIAGIINGDNREVVSGLKEGETVLSKAGGFFQTGDKVRVAQ